MSQLGQVSSASPRFLSFARCLSLARAKCNPWCGCRGWSSWYLCLSKQASRYLCRSQSESVGPWSANHGMDTGPGGVLRVCAKATGPAFKFLAGPGLPAGRGRALQSTGLSWTTQNVGALASSTRIKLHC
jgi:hypothetical protein